MIKEPGVFSQRYLMRKGKENHNSINQHQPNHHQNQNNISHAHQLHQTNHQNNNHNQPNSHHLTSQHDFPLAYTSAKTISRQRNSISVGKKKVDEKRNDLKEHIQQKNQVIARQQKQLRELKDQTKKVSKEMQSRYSQYDKHIKELTEELKQKEEALARKQSSLKDQKSRSNRFKETIKRQIYWLLSFFKRLHEGPDVQQVKRQVSNAFMAFKDYISQFNIEKQLQELASATVHQITSNLSSNSTFRDQPSKKNMDSIFTEDLEEVNMIKIMELQPLIETFNNQQYLVAPQGEDNNKMERITKRLFDDSEMFRESNQCSLMVGQEDRKNVGNSSQFQQNQFIPKQIELQLPKEVKVVKHFDPDSRHQNFICLKQGEILKLLRKIRDKLWIGELGDKIGLVSEEYFKLC